MPEQEQWTANQVKELFDRLLHEKQIALDLLAGNMKRELEHLNELRMGVVTRSEYESKHNDIERRMQKCESLPGRFIGAGVVITPVLVIFGWILSHLYTK